MLQGGRNSREVPLRAPLRWNVGGVYSCVSMRVNLTTFPATKTAGIKLDCGFGPRVANAVEGVKDLASEMGSYECRGLGWMCHSKGCVHPGNLHLF